MPTIAACFAGALALAAMATSAMAQNAQFDLVCTGAQSSQRFGYSDFKLAQGWTLPAPQTINNRIRVDLDKQVFCLDDCKKIETIVSIQPEEVALRQSPMPFLDVFVISRRDGQFRHKHFVGGDRDQGIPSLMVDEVGSCTKAPFTPLPQGVF